MYDFLGMSKDWGFSDILTRSDVLGLGFVSLIAIAGSDE
jgi:hypothetical protein